MSTTNGRKRGWRKRIGLGAFTGLLLVGVIAAGVLAWTWLAPDRPIAAAAAPELEAVSAPPPEAVAADSPVTVRLQMLLGERG